NAQNELNYINHAISESDFENVIENYANMVKFDDDIFIYDREESEEADTDYISNTENLNNLLQYNDRDLEIEEMFNFNIFLEEKTYKTTNSNVESEEDELDYNIEEVINASMK
ncbi:6856_t:CDS:1, partial [Scutellospora calospora]